MTKQTGGPAFPSPERHAVNDGMTLRDYFAANAPDAPKSWHGGSRDASDIVAWHWRYADLMLEARK
jgi:hypothetical protein